MSIDYVEAEARMQFYADTIGVQPPDHLLAGDGAPTPELLEFCVQYGASLDWIFLGDVRRMVWDSYKVARKQ